MSDEKILRESDHPDKFWFRGMSNRDFARRLDTLCEDGSVMNDASERIWALESEVDALKAELDAVMQLGVDKWLEGDALNNNTATRAAEARKVALGAIDALRAEVERLREAGKEVISADAEWGENPKQMENWADAIAHLEQALRGEGEK